jgi:hypothetical protein
MLDRNDYDQSSAHIFRRAVGFPSQVRGRGAKVHVDVTRVGSCLAAPPLPSMNLNRNRAALGTHALVRGTTSSNGSERMQRICLLQDSLISRPWRDCGTWDKRGAMRGSRFNVCVYIRDMPAESHGLWSLESDGSLVCLEASVAAPFQVVA